MTHNMRAMIALSGANLIIIAALIFGNMGAEPQPMSDQDKAAACYTEYINLNGDTHNVGLTRAYEQVKHIDERKLPVPLRDFVVMVKVSQFCK